MPQQDLSTLNGVTITTADKAPPKGSGFTYDSSTGTFHALHNYVYGGTTQYTISVLNNNYTAASGQDVATFGEIAVTNGSTHVARYYYVVGFAANGFLTGNFGNTPTSAAQVAVSGSSVTSRTEIFSTAAANSGSFPLTFTQTNDFAPPCFVSGTLIRTARGEVAVEALEVGDEVLTASGGMRPVIWLGSRRVRPALHVEPRDLYPVRIVKGAFGEGLPVRDLVVSPGHAVFVDGVLVPASRLINGATVVQDEVEQAHYFHVELDAHDVLLAEGLACESYLDDGNRAMFANGPETVALFGRLDTLDYEAACAPVLRGLDQDGEALAAIRGRLAARAEAMGWRRSDEARLTLLADGEALAPLHQAKGRAWFQVPAAEAVILASGAGRPADLLPDGRDRRTLGLAVGEVRVDGVALSLEDEAVFGQGFHAVERGEETAWRWTDGAARLHLDGPALVEVQVVMTALHWLRPARALRLVAVG